MEQQPLSCLDSCKTNSKYHFDNTKVDQPGEWFNILGCFTDYSWHDDLTRVKNNLRPICWSTMTTTLGRNRPNPLAESQELDIIRGGGDPKMTLVDINDQLDDYPAFQKMIQYFGLNQARPRFHAQHTGQVFNYHIDTFYTAWPGIPRDQLIRIGIMLEDWQPGQFYIFGNRIYDRWKAGEAHWFKWEDVPHGTANASSYPRYTLQVTGIRTDLTDEILGRNGYQNFKL